MADDDTTHIRPFAAFLQEHRQGAAHQDLSDEFVKLLRAVDEAGKPGTLTLTLKVKPGGGPHGGQVLIEDAVKVTPPKLTPGVSFFFLDEHGNPVRRNPNQPEIPGLAAVKSPPAYVDPATGEMP